MKPLSIADYLDHLGRAAGEKEPPRRESAPFRPRSLAAPQHGESGVRPLFERAGRAGGGETKEGDAPHRSPWAPKPIPAPAAQSSSAGEPASPEDIKAKLAEAHARGREEGLAQGRAEAQERHTAELAAVRERAETQRQEFHVNEYMEFEGAIRSGFRRIEETIGAAVTRILAPFLGHEAAKQAADELAQAIARLSEGGSPGLIRIRGPERMLARLRERIADLPIEVEYAEDEGVEAIVEAGATRIAAELRPWAELLAAFEA